MADYTPTQEAAPVVWFADPAARPPSAGFRVAVYGATMGLSVGDTIGYDTNGPYTDAPSPLVAAQPENRRYRMAGLATSNRCCVGLNAMRMCARLYFLLMTRCSTSAASSVGHTVAPSLACVGFMRPPS